MHRCGVKPKGLFAQSCLFILEYSGIRLALYKASTGNCFQAFHIFRDEFKKDIHMTSYSEKSKEQFFAIEIERHMPAKGRNNLCP